MEKFLKYQPIFDKNNSPNINYTALNGDDLGDIGYDASLVDGTMFSLWVVIQQATCSKKKCSSLKEFQEYRHSPTKLWKIIGFIEFDTNGAKGPNIWGRDWFGFYIGNDGTLYPYGGKDAAVYDGCNYDELDSCSYYWKTESLDWDCISPDSSGFGCAGRIMEENWEMKY